MNDYPAAHSMDTTWFAVDEDGCLALCESGEAGAVPESASHTDSREGESLRQFFFQRFLLQRQDLPTYLRRMRSPRTEEALPQESHASREVLFYQSLLCFVSEIWMCQRDLAAESCFLVPSSHHTAILYPEMDQATYDRLHKAGLCESCFVLSNDPLQEALGREVFLYGHGDAYENWISGPYQRDFEPPHPLRVEDFPPAIQAFFGSFRFPFRFRQTERFQPISYAPCVSWQDRYLDLEGRDHPFRRR